MAQVRKPSGIYSSGGTDPNTTKDLLISDPTFQNLCIVLPPDIPPQWTLCHSPQSQIQGQGAQDTIMVHAILVTNHSHANLAAPPSTHQSPPSLLEISFVNLFCKKSWIHSIGRFRAFGPTNWLIWKLGPNLASIVQLVSRLVRDSTCSSKGRILSFISVKAIGRLSNYGKMTGPHGWGIILLMAPPSPPQTLRGVLGKNTTVLTKKETWNLLRNTKGRRLREGNLWPQTSTHPDPRHKRFMQR